MDLGFGVVSCTGVVYRVISALFPRIFFGMITTGMFSRMIP